MFIKQAFDVIYNSISEIGLLASIENKDNYKKVWSRDAMMTGIVGGILYADEKIAEAFKKSILILAENQNTMGQIPSNVGMENNKVAVSYGSLVGRVDATTWWIIGAGNYIKNKNDNELKLKLKDHFAKALNILCAWEYNSKSLVYTPLGGNWADEYISSGYTLYDNSLRFWALKTAVDLYPDSELDIKKNLVKNTIEINFDPENRNKNKFHRTAFAEYKKKPHKYWASSFSSNGYEDRWDMAANAFSILLDLQNVNSNFELFLNQLNTKFSHWMLPVFYPIIQKTDWQFHLLENNFSFEFKNKPYYFQNGGSWPVFLGWLCLALNKNGSTEIPSKILAEYEDLMKQNPTQKFDEYWTTNKLKPLGTPNLCFSAIGYLMMKYDFKSKQNLFL